MATPYEDLRAAATNLIEIADIASTQSLTPATTFYGTDFRVPPGQAVYQVQITPMQAATNGSVTYPRALVTIPIHFYIDSPTNEALFLEETLYNVSRFLLSRVYWRQTVGVYGIEADLDPEMEPGDRTGNVLTFTVTAVVLMDAV